MKRSSAPLRVNARFDAPYRRKLELASRRLGLNVTDTLKAGLDKLVESLDAEARMRPLEALQKAGFIGCARGPSDLSATYKKYLSGSLERKHGAR
jgi:hypothetical protein